MHGSCHAACLVLVLAACSLDNDVGQPGEYTFLPRADVIDTAPRPLRHLLIVEEDAPAGAALVYLFSGELASADLGLTDLRRIAQGHGRTRMDFPPERASYLLDDLAEQLAEDESFEGDVLRVETADGDEHRLLQLNSAALEPTGAQRFLRTVDTRDYAVRAYYGHFALAGALPELALEVEGSELAFDPQLRAAALEVEREEELLRLSYGELTGADYVIVEALQTIRSVGESGDDRDAGAEALDAGTLGGDAGRDAGVPDDAAADAQRVLEALGRTTLPPDVAYEAGPVLVTDIAGRGCWAGDEPVTLRLIQVARRYAAEAHGDWAVIHRRIDATDAAPEQWSGLLEGLQPAAYCDDFE